MRLHRLSALIVAVLSLSAQAQGQANITSAQDIVAALDDANITRTMLRRPAAVPNPQTRICDPAVQGAWTQQGGEAKASLERNLVVAEVPSIDLDVRFKFGEASLLPEGVQQLDALAKALTHNTLKAARFVLAGHTDQVGSSDFNDRLSCERALAARNYLRDKHQITSDRLVPMGFGFLRLKDTRDPKADANRRVEVRRLEG